MTDPRMEWTGKCKGHTIWRCVSTSWRSAGKFYSIQIKKLHPVTSNFSRHQHWKLWTCLRCSSGMSCCVGDYVQLSLLWSLGYQCYKWLALNLCVRVWETFSCLFSCSYLFQYIYWYFELKENCQCFSWMQERAHQYYRAKHHHGASQQWSNFTFYRMENIRFFHLACVEFTIIFVCFDVLELRYLNIQGL